MLTALSCYWCGAAVKERCLTGSRALSSSMVDTRSPGVPRCSSRRILSTYCTRWGWWLWKAATAVPRPESDAPFWVRLRPNPVTHRVTISRRLVWCAKVPASPGSRRVRCRMQGRPSHEPMRRRHPTDHGGSSCMEHTRRGRLPARVCSIGRDPSATHLSTT
jgi:hypothetical protein